ncbi:MAG: hypothetical protein AB2L26_10755 [Ignavibacteria bacterium]
METFAIAFITAFVTILLNHVFEVYRKEISDKRELRIIFYAKIKRAEAEIYELILRANYGWGNPEEYRIRIGQSQQVYEKLLNEFYEVLLFNEEERKMTLDVIATLWTNIISVIIRSEDGKIDEYSAFRFYENDLQKSTEKLRKLYLSNSNTIVTKFYDWLRKEKEKLNY